MVANPQIAREDIAESDEPTSVHTISPDDDAYIGHNVVASHILDARHRLLAGEEILIGAFHGRAFAREEYGLTATRKGGMALHDYLLVTDRRVILWARGVFKESVDAYYYGDISSVEATSGLILGELVINVRGAKERFAQMIATDTPKAANMIRDRIGDQRNFAASPETEGSSSLQRAFDDLERLAALRDRGLVTEEEFAAKRQKIVDNL